MDAVTEGRKCLMMLIGIQEVVTRNYGLTQRAMSKVQAMDYSELKARIGISNTKMWSMILRSSINKPFIL